MSESCSRNLPITITASLLLSLIISLTLTPMMCARLLKDESRKKHGRLYLLFERGFDGLLALYARGLRVVLRHRFATLMVMLSTIALTGYLYVIIPKGFFPQQDTGQIVGITEASQDISFPAMSERQQALVDILLKDPAIESVASYIGPGGPTATLNQGRVFIILKPKPERKASADQIINRLKPKLAHIQGITLYMQAAQDITIGARLSKTQYQYTLTDADSNELTHWASIYLEKLRATRRHHRRRQRPGQCRPEAGCDGQSRGRVELRHPALDHRQHPRRRLRPAHRLHHVHLAEPVPRHLEVDPRFQYGPEALKDIYVNSASGKQVPLSDLVHTEIKPAPILINHQSMFPSVTISFNLKPGVALGDAVAAIQKIEKDTGKPASLSTSFQGNAQAFQSSLKGTPLADRPGAGRDLHHPGRAL